VLWTRGKVPSGMHRNSKQQRKRTSRDGLLQEAEDSDDCLGNNGLPDPEIYGRWYFPDDLLKDYRRAMFIGGPWWEINEKVDPTFFCRVGERRNCAGFLFAEAARLSRYNSSVYLWTNGYCAFSQ
jgi:hypothetical protein